MLIKARIQTVLLESKPKIAKKIRAITVLGVRTRLYISPQLVKAPTDHLEELFVLIKHLDFKENTGHTQLPHAY